MDRDFKLKMIENIVRNILLEEEVIGIDNSLKLVLLSILEVING